MAEAQLTRVSAYGVLLDEGRILLCRINEPNIPGHGMWTLPGGGLDHGEHPRDGARREIFEETGLHAEIGAILDVDSLIGPTGAGLQHAIRIIYRATPVGGNLTVEADGTTDACEWVPLEQCRNRELVSLAALGVRLAQSIRP